jgi:hypothetical protein
VARQRFTTAYLPLMRPFSAVPALLLRVRDAGLRIAIGSSAKKDELDKYLEIARIADLIHVKTSSDDADESKLAPDIFEVILKKLGIAGDDPSRSAIRQTMPPQRERQASRLSASSAAASRRTLYGGPDASTFIRDRPHCSPGSKIRVWQNSFNRLCPNFRRRRERAFRHRRAQRRGLCPRLVAILDGDFARLAFLVLAML